MLIFYICKWLVIQIFEIWITDLWLHFEICEIKIFELIVKQVKAIDMIDVSKIKDVISWHIWLDDRNGENICVQRCKCLQKLLKLNEIEN